MRRKTSMLARFLMTFLATLLALPAFAAETEANGVFLVAKRDMPDPRFRESVVLVTQPRQGGPWGVIINKPLAQRLAEVLPHHESLKKSPDVLHYGGPVMPQGLVFLARAPKPPPSSVAVLKGVYFTGDTAWIDRRLEKPGPTRELRVYAGYSGWSAGQLQNEMRRGDWHVVPADAAIIFDLDPARIWPELIARATTKQTHHSSPVTRHASWAGAARP
jgi:putative transcriptional regulator